MTAGRIPDSKAARGRLPQRRSLGRYGTPRFHAGPLVGFFYISVSSGRQRSASQTLSPFQHLTESGGAGLWQLKVFTAHFDRKSAWATYLIGDLSSRHRLLALEWGASGRASRSALASAWPDNTAPRCRHPSCVGALLGAHQPGATACTLGCTLVLGHGLQTVLSN